MKPFTFLSVPIFAALYLVGCATTPVMQTPAERLADALAGTYDRDIRDGSDPLRDQRIQLDPLGPGVWLYYQINEGENFSQVYRQRVLHLMSRADGTVSQTAYTLNEPETYQSADAPIDQITLDDLDSAFDEGCEMIWVEMAEGWAGRVDPGSCVIFSKRRQKEIRIASRTDLVGDRLRMAESGYTMDGERIWGSKDGEWLTLYRVDDAGT